MKRNPISMMRVAATQAAATKKESDPNETREDFIKRIEQDGLFEIVTPKPYQLQIDIDCAEHLVVFTRTIAILCRDHAGVHWHSKPSKSGGVAQHITVFIPWEVESPWERIAWQAALGSDPVREILSSLRCHHGDRDPTLFAELKP